MTAPDRSKLVRRRDIAAMLALSAGAWYVGANVWTSILVGAAITIVLRATSLIEVVQEGGFRSRFDFGVRARGGRSDVQNLAASLSRGWGRTDGTAPRRVVAIARRRLALQHLDLSNPGHRRQIEQLLGRRAYRSVTRSAYRRGMRVRSLVHCLDVLDTLDPAPRRPRDG
jgi:hypothetical protein